MLSSIRSVSVIDDEDRSIQKKFNDKKGYLFESKTKDDVKFQVKSAQNNYSEYFHKHKYGMEGDEGDNFFNSKRQQKLKSQFEKIKIPRKFVAVNLSENKTHRNNQKKKKGDLTNHIKEKILKNRLKKRQSKQKIKHQITEKPTRNVKSSFECYKDSISNLKLKHFMHLRRSQFPHPKQGELVLEKLEKLEKHRFDSKQIASHYFRRLNNLNGKIYIRPKVSRSRFLSEGSYEQSTRFLPAINTGNSSNLVEEWEQRKNIEGQNRRKIHDQIKKCQEKQTQFIKYQENLEESQLIASAQKFATKSIEFPSVENIGSFIEKYENITKMFRIQDIVESRKFVKEYCQTEGKEYLYFGEFDKAHDCKSGFGVQVTKNRIMEGKWVKGYLMKGAELKANGIYEGEFLNDRKNGEGTYKWNFGEEYTGSWKNGKRHGQGFWVSKNGDSYFGDWENGIVNGFGEYQSRVSKFRGSFVNFVKNGRGRQQFSSGDIYVGEYSEGKPDGRGKYVWKCNLVYTGQFIMGQRSGKGILQKQGLFELEGDFKNQRANGICRLKYSNGDVFTGKFVNGIRMGYGKMDYCDGRHPDEGIWNDFQLIEKHISRC